MASPARPAREHPDFYAALLQRSGFSVAVLDSPWHPPLFFGDAAALLEAALQEPDGTPLAAAIGALKKGGAPFLCAVALSDGTVLSVRGAPVGRRAVLYFQPHGRRAIAAPDTALVDALPQAAALMGPAGRLNRCNGAFAALWDMDPAWLASRPSWDAVLNRLREQDRLPQQRDFPAWKRQQQEAAPDETWHLPDGRSIRRRARAVAGFGLLLLFEDVTAQLRLETSLNLLTRVQQATLDTLDEAIAVFGTDGRILLYNAHFAALWRLGEDLLADQPHIRALAVPTGEAEIWDNIAAAVGMPDPRGLAPRTLRRGDGHLLALSLVRLPNGATMVRFSDVTDLERFCDAMDEDAAGQASRVSSAIQPR